MSTKSFIQILILLLIIIIIGGVYFKYFETKKNIVEEIDRSEIENLSQVLELEKKIIELEIKNEKLNNKNKNTSNFEEKSNINTNIPENNNNLKKIDEPKLEVKINKSVKKKEIENLIKDVEYTSIDQKGNKFVLLANSGKTNNDNKDVLDLENVRGQILSDKRDTIYIVSDYAAYNSTNLNSKFYDNVIIDYQDKQITCINFDINMETNKAIAYNDVIITDPKSVMKAGIVVFDLKTKDININPENVSTGIEVITN